MKVLLVSSEVAPFAKTGGLADVAGALPLALASQGIDVRVAMPGYGSIDPAIAAATPVLPHIDVLIGQQAHLASVAEGRLPGSEVPVYFVENPGFFHRAGLYQQAGKDYPDNARRFAFFCKAVVWMIKGLGWTPDVIHCNDWQTALLPVMLRTDDHMRYDAILQRIRVMYTIHNMAYQGMFPATTAIDIGFGHELFHPGALEFYGQLNFMKGGLLFSDILTTVSPTYAREIQTPEFGCGLEGVLAGKADRLHGIINGIDYNQWNPESDPHLPAHFSADDMAGKRQCKAALQNELGLTENPDVPLLVMISRLDPQKGLDILLPLIEPLMQRKLQLAILGTGLPEYHQLLETAAAKHRGNMAIKLKFDNGLAHRMEAGGDVFLMPSQYEPCGLNQLYSLRYGTVPVVRMTGGLADSVQQISADGTKGTGFVFSQYSPAAFLQSIDDCLAAYARPEKWRQVQLRGMGRNFSWDESARHYAALYAAMAS